MNKNLNEKIILVFKKVIKIAVWLIISIILLLICIALLIQIPFIQTKIVGVATSFVSNKTHTRVEIKKISISFPKSIVIQGLFLEDLNKDTLLYAGKVKVNLAFKDLLNNNIHIRSFALEDVTLNLKRPVSDTVFNYNFLLTAFSNTTPSPKKETESKSPWIFNIDNVHFSNIRLKYKDDYGGMNVYANLNQLKLKMDLLDLKHSIFKIDDLFIENLTAKVLILKSSIPEKTEKSTGLLPKITTAHLEINQTNITFADSTAKNSMHADIQHLTFNDASVDLQNQQISLDKISLSKSSLRYSTFDNALLKDSVVVSEVTSTKKSNWVVTVNDIDLNDNSLAYNIVNKPTLKKVFDANHLDYKHLTLLAKTFYYSSDKTEVSIKKFTAIDHNNFAVKKLETDFKMDQHSITAKNLKMNLNNSVIDADLKMQYASLNSLKDSISFLILNLNLKEVSIHNANILYFTPQLSQQAFFKNPMNITTVSGKINGSINNLKAVNLVVHTGVNTVVKTNFSIKGLPDVKTSTFDFPNLEINSGKQDISMMVGSSIPKSIELPENINLQIVFKGKLKSFETLLDVNSSFGSAKLNAGIDQNEKFNSDLTITDFDLGSLLKNKTMFGPVSLSAKISGQGLDKKTIKADIKAEVSEIYLNKYTYHKLNIDGSINGQQFDGKINLKDVNAAFDFEGLVNLNPGQEQYKFNLNILGIDLQKLNLVKDDIRISLLASADLKGGAVNKLNGKVGITNIVIAHNGKKHIVDSLLVASINESKKSALNVNSALIGIKYNGSVSLVDLPKEMNNYFNNYFPFSDTLPLKGKSELQDFNFEIQLHNHPILSEILFPQLKEFQPGLIKGSYNNEKNDLKISAKMNKIVYGSMEINDLVVDLNSDSNALNYKIFSTKISNSQIKFDNFLINGKIADQSIFTSVSSINENQNKKLLIRSQITKNKDTYKLVLDPNDFYLMNQRWNIANDNYIEFGKQGFLIHHLFIHKTESQINIASVHNLFNDDLNIDVINFKLGDLSGIIEKDTNIVKGTVDGNVLLKRVNNTYGITADVKINDLMIREIPIGNLWVKAENPTAEKFEIDVKLSGDKNNLTAKGYYVPKGGDNSLKIKLDIQSLSLETVQTFSMGNITKASGNLSGNFLIEGKTAAPDVTGEMVFNDALITLAVLNNPLHFKHETIQLKKDGIYFKSFTFMDVDQNKATIDGSVKMKNFKNFVFDLQINTKDFLLFNTTAKDNSDFYGRMIIDSKININGPMTLPKVDAKLKLKKGSNFTFAVPESKLTTDKGEDVVEFVDSLKFNNILTRGEKTEEQKTGITGFDISSIIEVDKQATLRLLMDPSSSDSLVVKGEAALSFSIDRSGKMSLTGAYNINDGSYLVSLESIIKKRFLIESGSTIIWNGDPLDAIISIDAVYKVRASPYDLLADQMAGMSDSEKGGYKQSYPFKVILKLRGEILHPQISFEIQLAPEDKGILGGAVNTKLNMLNEDASALNKQVFALLVLGRFIQENPLQSESSGTASAIRTTVGNFLSTQLNQLSSKVVTGVELNFDIQSYDDFQSGQAEGRTQVDIGLKKQLFNERLSVQVGGSVDVEGEKAKQNSASDITSDVTVEYKLTKDGRYRIKAFRHNQYEGAIEGQLVETGIGIMYVRDFNKWKEFFKAPKNKSESSKTQDKE